MSDVKKEKINFAQILSEDLKKHDLAFTSKVRGEDTVFTLPMTADNAPGINVKLIIDEDGDCKLRSYLASNVPAAKWPAMYSVLNALNAKYRYICLSMDKDGDICAAYDFTLFSDAASVFAQVIAMLFLYTDIADKCIPDIMQTLWAKAEVTVSGNHRAIKANLFEEDEEEDEE